jgi:hypothetical protein
MSAQGRYRVVDGDMVGADVSALTPNQVQAAIAALPNS